jgi:hypothetical protein
VAKTIIITRLAWTPSTENTWNYSPRKSSSQSTSNRPLPPRLRPPNCSPTSASPWPTTSPTCSSTCGNRLAPKTYLQFRSPISVSSIRGLPTNCSSQSRGMSGVEGGRDCEWAKSSISLEVGVRNEGTSKRNLPWPASKKTVSCCRTQICLFAAGSLGTTPSSRNCSTSGTRWAREETLSQLSFRPRRSVSWRGLQSRV